jgi:hypothetical protein
LHAYAFASGEPLHLEPTEMFHQPPYEAPKTGDFKLALAEYLNRQHKGQQELDEIAREKNRDIMFLRNNHLHWNSVYGQKGAAEIITQPHAPDLDTNGKRKRTTR